MRRRIQPMVLGLFAVLGLAGMGGCATVRVDDYHPPGYRLVFSDEFDGNALARSRWCTRFVYGGGPAPQVRDPACQVAGNGTLDRLNDERQRYVDQDEDGRPLHIVEGGVLSLTAVRSRGQDAFPYRSAMIRSKEVFRPGPEVSYYLTARVNLPDVKGTWPSFWINPGPDERGKLEWPPEIDIFDSPINGKEDRANMLHVGAIPSNLPKTIVESHPLFDRKWRNFVTDANLRDQWIETAAEWTEDRVCYFLNGTRMMCERYEWRHRDGRPAAPGHVLLNLAVGGQWAGRHGIDDAKFPTRLQVDHVRIYERRIGAASAQKESPR